MLTNSESAELTRQANSRTDRAEDARRVMVARVWRKHGLQPHRMERYIASNDPEFETKAADVTGLYLKPASACRSVRRG